MATPDEIVLIAPCGMNCAICMAYLRDRNKCPGCRSIDVNAPVSRSRCVIKNCAVFRDSNAKFCYECATGPCRRLKQLDRRYRTKYGMSMLENLEFIRKSGIGEFVQKEKARWACAACGGTICVHRGYCSLCGKEK